MRPIAQLIGLSLIASAGCQSTAMPMGEGGSRPSFKRPSAASPVKTATEQPPQLPNPERLGIATLTGKVRLIPSNPAALVGKVRLGVLSNQGGELLSDNGGSLIGEGGLGLISDAGGQVISNNGGGVISNNGGGLTGQARAAGFRLAGVEAGKVAEAWLAQATIEVVNAEGRAILDASGEPVRAVSDETGTYTLQAVLPAESLLLRVRTFSGDTLLSLVPREVGAGGTWQVPVDTVSSLGASYVLKQYVKERQAVFNLLPGTEAVALYHDMAQAVQGGLSAVPAYDATSQLDLVEQLRGGAPSLSGTLERIKGLLLAGQSNLGEGLLASDVALSTPVSALEDTAGSLYIAEGLGRIRRVGADGHIELWIDEAPLGIGALLSDGEGGWLMSQPGGNRVRRIHPDGTLSLFAGNGQAGAGATGGAATDSSLDFPVALARAPDGTVYMGEQPRDMMQTGRVLHVDAAGRLLAVPCPEPEWQGGHIAGLAAGDGVLWALEAKRGLLARKAGEGPWRFVARGLAVDDDSRLWLEADGTVLVSEGGAHRVVAFDADGNRRVLAGTGLIGATGDGGPAVQATLSGPSGLWRAPDGRLVIVDRGNGLVREVSPSGIMRTVAGSLASGQVGTAADLAINEPSGLAVDASNRVLVSERTGSTIKRLEKGTFSPFAGTQSGFGGDGGPATSAQFKGIWGIALSGETLYVVDGENRRIRRIAPDGTVTTVAGTGESGGLGALTRPALETGFHTLGGITIAPDGLPTFADTGGMKVLKLTAEGDLKLIAGNPNGIKGYGGDGGAATAALLSNPASMTYDAAGNLYIADTGNMCIRKVDTDGNISTVAGRPLQAAMQRLFAGQFLDPEGVAAGDALILFPLALAVGSDGNVYFSEYGTRNVEQIGKLGFPPGLTLAEMGSRIRKLTPDGHVFSVAGEGSRWFGDARGDNALNGPGALAFDRDGRLLVADTFNNQIKVIPRDALQ